MRKKSVFWLAVLAACMGQMSAQEQEGILANQGAKEVQGSGVQASEAKASEMKEQSGQEALEHDAKQDRVEDNAGDKIKEARDSGVGQSEAEAQGKIEAGKQEGTLGEGGKNLGAKGASTSSASMNNMPQGGDAEGEAQGEQNLQNPPSITDLNPTKAKSGFYLQSSIGATFNRAIFDGDSVLGVSKYNATAINTMIGAGAGYQVFFTPHHGLRVFGTSLYGDFKSEQYKQNRPFNVITTGVGVDYLWDFSDSPDAFGFFVGTGYQWNYGEFFRDLKKASFVRGESMFRTHGFFAQIGFSKIFDWRHRIELAYRMPLYHFFDFAGKGVDSNGAPYDIAKAQYFSAGVLNFNYIYVFGGKDAR